MDIIHLYNILPYELQKIVYVYAKARGYHVWPCAGRPIWNNVLIHTIVSYINKYPHRCAGVSLHTKIDDLPSEMVDDIRYESDKLNLIWPPEINPNKCNNKYCKYRCTTHPFNIIPDIFIWSIVPGFYNSKMTMEHDRWFEQHCVIENNNLVKHEIIMYSPDKLVIYGVKTEIIEDKIYHETNMLNKQPVKREFCTSEFDLDSYIYYDMGTTIIDPIIVNRKTDKMKFLADDGIIQYIYALTP